MHNPGGPFPATLPQKFAVEIFLRPSPAHPNTAIYEQAYLINAENDLSSDIVVIRYEPHLHAAGSVIPWASIHRINFTPMAEEEGAQWQRS